jgi:hypothetical protein
MILRLFDVDLFMMSLMDFLGICTGGPGIYSAEGTPLWLVTRLIVIAWQFFFIDTTCLVSFSIVNCPLTVSIIFGVKKFTVWIRFGSTSMYPCTGKSDGISKL